MRILPFQPAGTLEFTTDAAFCLAELPPEQVVLGTHPRPHWQAGDAAREQPAAASLVIMRSLSKGDGPQVFQPVEKGLHPV